jgi:hypothetical protein
MSFKEQVRSVLICDDVRKEASGKDIAIGIYNGLILFNEFPGSLPTFAIRIEFVPQRTDYESLNLGITSPNGEPLIVATGKLAGVERYIPVAINFIQSPMAFEVPGIYRIFMEIDGQRSEVSKFHVQRWGDESYKPAFPT